MYYAVWYRGTTRRYVVGVVATRHAAILLADLFGGGWSPVNRDSTLASAETALNRPPPPTVPTYPTPPVGPQANDNVTDDPTYQDHPISHELGGPQYDRR